ncbi:hypothetical protein [Formosa maritima]|uniref:HTTM domain-containing protein n=1 Tax=Formosa maritima TaxID=2592046 RepID=A0A5D0GJ02_9FLAO|nr:hypothetical protein [Formosa maritima]TYA58299.1 hypothetical protein FVF61_03745 [Formosa maritima]
MKEITKSHFFWKYSNSAIPLFGRSKKELYNEIITIEKFSYLFFLFALFVYLFADNHDDSIAMIDPLWPMIPFINISTGFLIIFFQINLFLSFILLCFKPNQKFLKVYVFIIYFLYIAFNNSFGKINHGSYLALMMLFSFVFIPTEAKKNYKEKTILIFATAQFFLLMAYSLTGAWKLFWGIVEFFTKDVSLFSPLSFRNIIITQYQFVEPTILGKWFLEHYIFGWFMYLAVVYIEISSVFIFFRPNLHKIWGALLLSLHLGIHFVLRVDMFSAPLYIGLLLLMSPFYYKTEDFKTTLLSLPIISECRKLFQKIKSKSN